MNEFRTDQLSLPDRRRSATITMPIVAAFIGLTMSLELAGCAWVSVSQEGAMVDVARSESTVSGCKQVGVITAKTQSQIGIIPRNFDRITEELEGLARNDAVGLGANTVLPIGSPDDVGSQKFHAYRCPPP